MKTNETKRVLGALLLAGGVLLGATSCGDIGCRGRNESELFLYSVTAATSPREVPDDTGEDEVVVRETYSLDRDGNFTLSRTTRRVVAAIGASVASLNSGIAERFGVPPFSGVLVLTARQDGPARNAGVRVDDIITAIGEDAVTSREQFRYLVSAARPGDRLEIQALREGEKVSSAVELGTDTVTDTSEPLVTKLPILDDRPQAGLRLAQVTADVAPYILGPGSEQRGLLVVENVPGGPGFQADIRIRDCIVQVDGSAVESFDQYSGALASLGPGDRATLTVLRDGPSLEKTLRLVEDANSSWAFNALGLVKYERTPGHWRFSLLWGLLFNAQGHSCIRKRTDYPQNSREGSWGIVVDLLAWRSTPREKELRIAWILPISVRTK